MKTAEIHSSEIFISTLKTGAVRSSETSDVSSVKSWLYKLKHVMVKYESFSEFRRKGQNLNNRQVLELIQSLLYMMLLMQ
jgi:hypothetical protein